MIGDFQNLLTALMDQKRQEGVCVDIAKAKIDAATLHEQLTTGIKINLCGWAKAVWVFLLTFHHISQHSILPNFHHINKPSILRPSLFD